ncbi:hypothetical protein EVAR_61879_1 [Eumeta japonica]|uniref:Uncharacterized protein n=1 Tax=Eumeta variegata TaxID=151549 RepID=A0A4C1YW27_EUMVA|nr:hypothetical protein EVAR_61879_1 [Eumeta japonica]
MSKNIKDVIQFLIITKFKELHAPTDEMLLAKREELDSISVTSIQASKHRPPFVLKFDQNPRVKPVHQESFRKHCEVIGKFWTVAKHNSYTVLSARRSDQYPTAVLKDKPCSAAGRCSDSATNLHRRRDTGRGLSNSEGAPLRTWKRAARQNYIDPTGADRLESFIILMRYRCRSIWKVARECL